MMTSLPADGCGDAEAACAGPSGGGDAAAVIACARLPSVSMESACCASIGSAVSIGSAASGNGSAALAAAGSGSGRDA
jgi:hypothetical protein